MLWWTVRQLRSKSSHKRAQAAATLGGTRDARAVEPLVAALGDENAAVRQAVVGTLAQIGLEAARAAARAAVPALLAALTASDYTVRRAAAAVLGQLRDARAVEPLVDVLLDGEQAVQWAAIEALPHLAPHWAQLETAHTALPVLVAAFMDGPERVQWAAAEALTLIGTGAVEPVCRALWTKYQEGATAAREAVARLARGGRAATELWLPMLEAPDWQVRWTAAQVLGELRERQAVEPLLTILHDLSSTVRTVVAEALGKLRDVRAVAPLVAALEEPAPAVHWAAGRALEQLAWQPANDKQRVLYAVARHAWEELKRLRSAYAIDPLLTELFAGPGSDVIYGTKWKIEQVLLELVPVSSLTAEMVHWIGCASTYEHKSSGAKYDAGHITLEASDKAIRSLCRLNSPVTSNVLHLVAHKPDISVFLSTGCNFGIGGYYENVSFQTQRQMALHELQRRGNPPYRPEAYLK